MISESEDGETVAGRGESDAMIDLTEMISRRRLIYRRF
jgi:hypothetical protein